MDFSRFPVYWLNGLAGTGKSAIAQTFAERAFADGHLGASFFCSRESADRGNLQFIFPTLAVQLARKYTEFRSILVPLARSDPDILRASLYRQMEEMIVRPLKKSGISTVIVIDALDECEDEEPASVILSILGRFVSEIPEVKFFITGRPEPHIREGFRLPLLARATEVFTLHEVGPSQVESDIRLYFTHELSELKASHDGLDDWPTKVQLDLLCEQAGGLFVYAVASVEFIGNTNHDPRERLDRLLESPGGSSTHTGNTALDSLYMSILQEAFNNDDPEVYSKIRSVLGAVVLAASPLSPSTIATLLGFDTEEVFLSLSLVQSLLVIQEDVNHPVRPLHRSFPEFIVDPDRCTDERFRVSPPDHHPGLLIGCLDLMNRSLEKNMCGIPDAVTNDKIDDLQERAEQYIGPGLRYACESWHKHPVDAHTPPAHIHKITSLLHRFLQKKFLFWLEVLSVLDNVRDAVDALDVVTNWLEVRQIYILDQIYSRWIQESPTLDLVNDYSRFVTGFFEVISASAPHIYHSALPLAPRTSIVRKLYEQYARPLTGIVRGVPMVWDPTIATTKCPYLIWRTAWSSCGKFIAVRGFDSAMGIQILDAVTLKQLRSFAHQEGSTQLFAISVGSRVLTWLGRNSGAFTSWDLRTGVPVSEIPIQGGRSAREARSITYSGCGTMFGVLFKGRSTPAIGTCNVTSGTSIHYHPIEGSVADMIWTCDGCVRFATLEPRSITIWEVGFSSESPPAEVESLPTPDGFDPSGQFLLLPACSRLAFTLEEAVLVWDIQGSKPLLNSADVGKPGKMAFSPDGRFFACGTDGPKIYLWKESPTGYVPHRLLISGAGERSIPREPLLSPDGQSIVVSDGSMLQLWRTTDLNAEPTRVPTQVSQSTKRFILGFSPDESLAAVVRLEDDTITILDLKSGVPRVVINAGTKIRGVRVAESTVVIVGDRDVITWNLPAGDGALDIRLNINDSVRKATLYHPTPLEFPPTPSASISPNLNHIALAEPSVGLRIYDTSTGKYLVGAESRGDLPWFTPDAGEVWCHSVAGEGEGWAIVNYRGSDVTNLESLDPSGGPPGGFPWQSPLGYTVTDNGWVISPRGKQLLWLPPNWRSGRTDRAWGERFLALLHPELPEAVVLELLQE